MVNIDAVKGKWATPEILFGAAYYLEYQPTDRLDEDLDLMVEAGFSIIRVGESVWSTWEPEEGVFDLEWLSPVLDGAHARGIKVILGTPTYAVPPWMPRLYPEIAGDTSTGVAMKWGMRQEVDFTHPAFRFFAERVIRRILGRYGDHPAIVGFQVDNEPGIRLLYNRGVFQKFVTSLQKKYRTVEALNEEWGLVYWSHRLSTWSDLWVPDGNTQPQYDLAWRRFQAELVTEFIGWQAGIVREALGPALGERFITTCISYDQVGVEDVAISAELTVASGNAYYNMEETLAHPSQLPMSPGWIVDGPWAVYQLADLMYSSKQAPFMVTETNAGAIGFGSINSVAYNGQWRQAAWALISRGATMIEYWHWHTLHFGTETYWVGVLPHDGKPGRAYEQIAELGGEIKRISDRIVGALPDADVAFVYDSDSKWALGFGPQSPIPAGHIGLGDPDGYRQMTLPFYRGAFDSGLQVNTVRPDQLFGQVSPAQYAQQRSILVAVGLYTATDSELEWLREYAAAGGHLILGPKTGYADEEGRARQETKPALLAEAAGVSYQEFANPSSQVNVQWQPKDGAAQRHTIESWIDFLRLEGAEILASYDHPHYSQWPAVVTNSHGAGRVTTVGTVPSQELAHQIMAWAKEELNLPDWAASTASVRVTSMTRLDDKQIFFVHNWGWTPATVTVPMPCTEITTETSLNSGDVYELGAWDVRIYLSN